MERYIKFQRALDYLLSIRTPNQVVKELIEAAREGWANKKMIETPYLKMT